MLKLNEIELNILVSFAYYTPEMNDLFKNLKIPFKLLIDSGAFTIWKKGKEIKVTDYCKFINSLPIKPWRYFNLDVIGDPKKTLENYNIMLSENLTPIPIFTRGEEYKTLDLYYQTSDVVGIGGLVGTKNRKNIVKKVMRHVGNKKVHWLGFTDLDYIKYFKPYMCDSSAWSRLARFGEGTIYIGNGKQLNLRKKHCSEKPSKEILEGISSLGFDPYLLQEKKNWTRSVLNKIGMPSSVKLMLDVKKNLDVNMFIACCSNEDVHLAINAYKQLIGQKK